MISDPRIWGDALRQLQKEIPDFAFDAWIRPLAVKISDGRVVLGCPSSFHRDRVRIQFQDALERNLRAAADIHSSREEGRQGRPANITLPRDPSGRLHDAPPSIESSDEFERPLSVELVVMSELGASSGHVIEIADLAELQEGEDGTHATSEVSIPRQLRRVVGRSGAQDILVQDIAVEGGGASQGRPIVRPTAGRSMPGGETSREVGPELSEGAHLEAVAPPRSRRSQEFRPIAGAKTNAVPPSDSMPRESMRRELIHPQHPQHLRHPGRSPGLRGSESAVQPELPFSFESFVVGPCNALAREAALALARTRQRSLNLLYLGGDSGMGKTHLARATAAEARRHNGHAAQNQGPRDRAGVVYTSAEQFTSEFVSAMRNGRSDDFKRRYRGPIGLLVVEDIQFFSGRVKTQLELFHTLQHVLDAGGRVLLTGDRTPRELSGLDERVRAQVGQGFVAELEPPDAIVRRHILRSKAAAGGVHLPADCLDVLVETSQGSVRDIEGILIQVVTTASLLGRTIDMDLTREAIALKSSAGSVLTSRTVAVSEIVRIVSAFFGKRPEALASRSRRRDVLIPRQLAMYLAHRYTDASFAEIGRGLGRGHPSVRNAIERIDRQILENAPVRYQVEALSERIDSTLKEGSRADRSD